METRKIQEVSGGTYTVSIPLDWAQEHDIAAGHTAYLYTHRDGSLLVRWNDKERSELATTDIELAQTEPDVAQRLLCAAYTAGFKQIHLRNAGGFASAQRRAIDATTHGLPGVEITEESTEHVTVLGLLDPSEVSVRQSAIQMRYITLSMYDAALDFFVGESTESDHLATRDDEVDRLFRLITRHLNRSLVDFSELDQLGIDRPQLFEYYETARQFERIADHAVKITRCVQRTDYPVPEELLTESRAIGADARQVVETASHAMIDGASPDKAHAALEDGTHVIQAARSLDRSLSGNPPEAAYLLTRVLDSFIRTVEYGGNIAELALRRSLRT